MNNGIKIKATIFIVLFLLLIALIVYIISGSLDNGNDTSYYPSGNAGTMQQTESIPQGQNTGAAPVQPQNNTVPQPAAPEVPVQAPVYTQQPAPVYTVAPTPIPTLQPTPEPTPAPTPTPQPVGMPLGNGQFRSDSGSLLNIHADWSSAVADESSASVTVEVYVDHYQLDYEAYKNLTITVGDSSQTVESTSIHYDTAGLCSTHIGSATFSVSASRGEIKSFPLEVKWHFGGVYGDGKGSKVDVDTLICRGDITVAR